MSRKLALLVSGLLAACSADSVATRTITAPDAHAPRTAPADKGKIKSSGQLVVWGDNSGQQISDAPIHDDIEAIAAGGGKQGLVIRRDGSLWLWGSVGGTYAPPIPPDIANDKYKDAYLVATYLLAIRNDNTVIVSGNYVDGTPVTLPAGLKARDVAGGGQHGIAIGLDGRLSTWGASLAPPDGKFSEVAARTAYSIALRADGTLFGWGRARPGVDLFAGWKADDNGHFFIPGQEFVAIAAGNNHIVALRADGTVAGWGQNDFGETVAPAEFRFSAIAAGFGFSIGLDEDGCVHQWGDASGGTAIVPDGRFASIAAGSQHASALRAASNIPNSPVCPQ